MESHTSGVWECGTYADITHVKYCFRVRRKKVTSWVGKNHPSPRRKERKERKGKESRFFLEVRSIHFKDPSSEIGINGCQFGETSFRTDSIDGINFPPGGNWASLLIKLSPDYFFARGQTRASGLHYTEIWVADLIEVFWDVLYHLLRITKDVMLRQRGFWCWMPMSAQRGFLERGRNTSLSCLASKLFFH